MDDLQGPYDPPTTADILRATTKILDQDPVCDVVSAIQQACQNNPRRDAEQALILLFIWLELDPADIADALREWQASRSPADVTAALDDLAAWLEAARMPSPRPPAP